jgi:HK97 family phage portal protein
MQSPNLLSRFFSAQNRVTLADLTLTQQMSSTAIKNADSALVKSGDPQVLELFGMGGNSVAVTPNTAQRLSAVGACIGITGDAMSTLPLHHYKNIGGNRERVKDNKIWNLLNRRPIGNWTSASMYQWWVRCNILRGDAYTEIIRDKYGEVLALKPWHPDRVQVRKTGNELIYQFSPEDGSKPYARFSDDVLHMPGNGFDGIKSLSAISHDARNAIGIALAATEYSKRFFENGASPKHIFETEKTMNPEQIDQFRDVYDTRYAGPANAGRPMILTEGLKMHALNMTSVDAQLLESIKYSVIDIARACRVPPVLIGAQETTSSWGTGVSEIKQGFVTFNLEPRANLWEQEINNKLIRKEDEFVEFQFKGFLRGDAKAEAEAMRQARGGSQGPGWLTLNEIRKIDNLPPAETGGDIIYEPKGASNEQKTATTN